MATSSHTFSGGEDFCYTLQALGRAQVIGVTTGGGAHPTRPFPMLALDDVPPPIADEARDTLATLPVTDLATDQG